jgi:hypothetical protein
MSLQREWVPGRLARSVQYGATVHPAGSVIEWRNWPDDPFFYLEVHLPDGNYVVETLDAVRPG